MMEKKNGQTFYHIFETINTRCHTSAAAIKPYNDIDIYYLFLLNSCAIFGQIVLTKHTKKTFIFFRFIENAVG